MELGLDIAAGCGVAIDEMYGDWYRDPWGWAEFTWLSRNPAAVDVGSFLRKTRDGYELAVPASFHLTEVPKDRLAVRPAVIQDSLSRLLYATAVASNLKKLHRNLPDWAFGWRSRDTGLFAKNWREWTAYLEKLAAAPPHSSAGLHVDIASCFASIGVERLADLVHQRLGKIAAAGVIADVLRRHDSLTTRSGIPQRSFSSAALAHLYLQPLDDALVSATAAGVPFVTRWMDDVTALGKEEQLYALYLDLQDRAQQIGLGLNAAKSKLVDAGDIVSAIRADDLKEIPMRERTVEGYAGPTVVRDTTELLKTEEAILDKPAATPRSLLRATLTSLIRSESFDRWSDWLEVAHKIPHVADTLGRYLRSGAENFDVEDEVESQRWEQLEAWFLDFAGRSWGKVDWVTAQLALAFPTPRLRTGSKFLMCGWLESSDNVQKVAIATQRLALRSPVDCRDIIRSRVDRTSDPVLLRVLGLGLLLAGDDRGLVRSVLDRDRRNTLVVSMLDSTGWRCPSVVKDFDQE